MAAKNRICTLKCDHHDPETETAGWLSPPARSEAERFSAKGTATHFLAGAHKRGSAYSSNHIFLSRLSLAREILDYKKHH